VIGLFQAGNSQSWGDLFTRCWPASNAAAAWDAGAGWWNGLFARLHQFRRLRVRYDKRNDIHDAFLSLGCALIC
jgi:hypothetical protein